MRSYEGLIEGGVNEYAQEFLLMRDIMEEYPHNMATD